MTAATPRLARAVADLVVSGNYLGAVDTNHSRYIYRKELPKRLHRDDFKVNYQYRPGWYTSLYLTDFFRSISHLDDKKQKSFLVFITVKFALATAEGLMSCRKSPASAYGDILRARFKGLSVDYFLVMEGSTPTDLHAHIIMSFCNEDENTIRELLRKDVNDDSGVMIQTTYRRYLNAEPDSQRWHENELDIEYGISQYTKIDAKGRWYRECPVDVGAADYISKELAMPLMGSTGRRLYAPRRVAKLAKELGEQAYQLSKESKKLQ